jgi:hydrogenase expression/formation protein HypD
MRRLDEYRDPAQAHALARSIARRVTRPWVVMEICGGQTHTLVRYGIDEMLPPEVELVHGPGCPVCVTPVEIVDQAIAVAQTPGAILASYGDMLRVPGSCMDLQLARAKGGDVRVVYSPMDALKLARKHPERQVVFLAIGFDTTAPAHALTVLAAQAQGVGNFSLLVSHVSVPPAIRFLLTQEGTRVQGFIAPGHVCTVMGYAEYEPLAREFGVPFVVTGFEPLDLLQGIAMLVAQLEEGRAEVENQYTRSVVREGNAAARQAIARVFEPADRAWRGIGIIPASGLQFRQEFAAFDAARRFELKVTPAPEPAECIGALVLQGRKKPRDCAAFGGRCTPENPLGAPMVSGEGACAAYYRFRRFETAGHQ